MNEPRGFFASAFSVTRRNLRVWLSYAGANALGNFGEPLLYLVALGFGLGKLVPSLGGMSYAEFIAPGLVVSTVMYTATFESCFGAYTRLTVQRTFDAVLATPVEVPELIFGEILWGAFKACFGGAIVLSVITLFGLVPSWWALGVLPLAFVAGLCFSAIALCVTAVSPSYEAFNYYFTLVVAPQFMFSGIFFPLGELPSWAQRLALVMPLTHVVALARPLVRGEPALGLLVHALMLLGFASVAGAVCARALSRRIRG